VAARAAIVYCAPAPASDFAMVEKSLPAWIYRDPAFFALEREHLFPQTWQVVCHVNDVPNAGDYQTLKFLDEMVVVVRADDGQVRAFHNVCRHRASRLVAGEHGNCGHRIVCPYHAWSYGLDGRLVNVPKWQGFEDLDKGRYGLAKVEMEIYQGFVFIRLKGGGLSVVEMMEPYAAEIASYDFPSLVPQGRVTLRPRPVNWKIVADNYSDGLHIPVAHPGLTRLFGNTYGIEAKPWVDKMWGKLQERESSNWSERTYQSLLKRLDNVAAERRRWWVYYKLWPNVAFDVYPDQVDFMQFVPVSATETMIREIAYVWPDDRRETRALRYLNWRINRQVNTEDTSLIAGVQAGMASSSYTVGPIASAETCLLAFAERLSRVIPEARLETKPVH
jgi:phenylpropionate dioxygenase-like ring-hydroxylating dioxygenase large terminal subunit